MSIYYLKKGENQPSIHHSPSIHLFVILVLTFQSASLFHPVEEGCHIIYSLPISVHNLPFSAQYFLIDIFPIPGVPFCQVLMFILTIISFLPSIFTRSRSFTSSSIYPIKTRVFPIINLTPSSYFPIPHLSI